MKKITLLTLSLICALFVTSCSDDVSDSYDDATILVSKKEIEYGKGGGSETFTVTINKKNGFIAQLENFVDWAEASTNGDVVTVTVKPNETIGTRTAKIIVFTHNGGLKREVNITQTATDLIFNTTPDKVQFTRLGGEKEVRITTNDTDWTTEGGADWVKIEEDRFFGIIRLTATENKLDDERTTFITLKSGTEEKEIEVSQKGLVELILPYQNFGVLINEVVEFEEARGHIYRFSPKTQLTPAVHEFMTFSYLMPRVLIDYTLGVYAGAVVANTIPKDNGEEIKRFRENYSALLVDNGYGMKTEMEYRKPTDNEEADVTAIIYGNGVVFDLYYKQTKPMPTFDKFPYGFIEWGSNQDKVDEYELSIGGVNQYYPPGEGYMLRYVPGENDPDVSHRMYFFNDYPYIDLYQTEIGIKGYSKIAYLGKDNKLRETEEFLALLEKENFKYYNRNGDGSLLTYIRPSAQGEAWVTVCNINVWVKFDEAAINLLDMSASALGYSYSEKISTEVDYRVKRADVASQNSGSYILR